MAFLDIRPFNIGHTLVIPKAHYPDYPSLPVQLIAPLMQTVQHASRAVSAATKPDGMNIIANIDRAAGQTVFHCHFHIMPRYHSDDIKMKINFKKYETGQMNSTAVLIRSAWQKTEVTK